MQGKALVLGSMEVGCTLGMMKRSSVLEAKTKTDCPLTAMVWPFVQQLASILMTMTGDMKSLVVHYRVYSAAKLWRSNSSSMAP